MASPNAASRARFPAPHRGRDTEQTTNARADRPPATINERPHQHRPHFPQPPSWPPTHRPYRLCWTPISARNGGKAPASRSPYSARWKHQVTYILFKDICGASSCCKVGCPPDEPPRRRSRDFSSGCRAARPRLRLRKNRARANRAHCHRFAERLHARWRAVRGSKRAPNCARRQPAGGGRAAERRNDCVGSSHFRAPWLAALL